MLVGGLSTAAACQHFHRFTVLCCMAEQAKQHDDPMQVLACRSDEQPSNQHAGREVPAKQAAIDTGWLLGRLGWQVAQ